MEHNRKIVKCRTCQSEIFFIKMNGKYHPVNVMPKLVYILDELEGLPAEWILTKGYESHFSNCPEAKHFRKNKD